MLGPQESLRETHLIGPRCREWIVSRDRFPQLRALGLGYIGHSVLYPPYRMVRLPTRDSHIVACTGGTGRALIGGREVTWREGQVLLSAAGTTHAFEVEGRGPWRIAWLFFADAGKRPAFEGPTRLQKANAHAFVQAVQAITQEASGPADPAAMQALAALVDIQARRLAKVRPRDDRLWRLWELVESDLAHPWSLELLARRAAVSEEHLRRLTWREQGRTPVVHLTHLRMHRASTLLRTTSLKLDDIAQRVGFASVYSFSAAFKRWSGLPPSRFRERPAIKNPGLASRG